MAKDVTSSLNYWIKIEAKQQKQLLQFRLWNKLWVAFDSNWVWVKGFQEEELQKAQLLAIPSVERFYEKEAKLYPVGTILPYCKTPELLWEAIGKAFPVKLPKLNFNYFGIQEQLKAQLIPAEVYQKEVALLCSVSALKNYIQTAPQIRLQGIKWVILNTEHVLLLGSPSLPIKGDSFWQLGNHLIPSGLTFESSIIAKAIEEKEMQAKWMLWKENNQCMEIPKTALKSLSRGSFNLTTFKA